jgi:hypothetical protein
VSPLHCLPPFVRATEEEEGAAEVLHQRVVSEPRGSGLWRGDSTVSTATVAAAYVAHCDAVRAVDAEARRRHAAASRKVMSSAARTSGVCRRLRSSAFVAQGEGILACVRQVESMTVVTDVCVPGRVCGCVVCATSMEAA